MRKKTLLEDKKDLIMTDIKNGEKGINIAMKYNVSYGTLQSHLRKWKIRMPKRTYNIENIKQDLANTELTLHDICKKNKLSWTTLWLLRKKHNLI